MNDEYSNVRFRAEPPAGGLPERFGVVTACNPDGVSDLDEKNRARTEVLRARLEAAGLAFFPVTGGSPDFSHREPGFGLVAPSIERVIELGREFHQEAVFWVENGEVQLVSCVSAASQVVGRWRELQFAG